MAYIIIVNPNQITGFSEGLGHIWNAVYVGSILVAVAGTLIMGLYAKMPFAQACGMGLNSFFFVSFILPELMNGGDPVEGYHAGLVIVFVSGLVFLVLSITGARQYIAKAMPPALKVSVSAGIGLFIAYIGFQNVGFIQDNQYTLTQLVDIHGAIANGELLNVVPAILGFIGFLIIVILGKRGVRGNVIIGIFSTALLYYVIVREAPQFDYSQVGQSFRDFLDVGVLMLGNIKKIDMTDLTSAAVGFMTVISMLLTYSIANGIGIGAITYTVITIFTGKYSGKDIMVTIIALLFVLKFCMITM